MSGPNKGSERKPTAFEEFVAAILKVPKDAIKEAEDKRLKRASGRRHAAKPE